MSIVQKLTRTYGNIQLQNNCGVIIVDGFL